MSILKFFNDLDVHRAFNNQALIESDMYRHPNGAYLRSIAYEATDSSCWYVGQGNTQDVAWRFNKLNNLGSHADVDRNINLARRVETRAQAQAMVEADVQEFKVKGADLFRTTAQIRAFNGQVSPA